METSFLEFELDFFRSFFSTANEEENELNCNIVSHQKSVLSPYSIGICLCYLISMINNNDIREKVAKELINVDLGDFQKTGNEINETEPLNNENQSGSDYDIDMFLKNVFKLISEVEDNEDSLNTIDNLKSNIKLSNLSSLNQIISNDNENKNSKRNFFTANLVFSLLSPDILSPESDFFQNSNAIQHIDYISQPVYKMINKTIKKLTFGNIHDLMNPLMHFTDNSIAFSALLYFEDKFNENNCFDSVETCVFHTFAANSRRRKSTIMGQKTPKAQHNENQNFCFYCQQSEPKLMSSSQSFTSLYQHTTSSIKVQMMKMTGKTPLCNEKSKNYFSIELPLSDNKFSLICIIPRNKGEDSFSNLIQSMNFQEFHINLSNMEPCPYDILLPFFSFSTESFDLISPITEFEAYKMFLFNNSLTTSEEEPNIPLTGSAPHSDYSDSKKKKKVKTKKIKKKKKSSTSKTKNANTDESKDKIEIDNIGDSKESISNSNNNISDDSNNNTNDSKYFYCPHCGARKLRNNLMIGQECMLKNIKLNDNAFVHHFRQKCVFSVNLKGIGKKNNTNAVVKSNAFNSWSSTSSISSLSSFESIIDNENEYQPENDKDTKSKGKDKKKKERQTKKVFDHPFIFFLTRRNPDIIIQYGVVTVPTYLDDAFLV